MPATASDDVYRGVRLEIQQGRVQPGTRVREESVAERFGVSRTPVREALRRLAQEGLLERSARGFVVTRLSPRKINEIYSIVGVLEALAAREAAGRVNETSLAALEALMSDMQDACSQGDVARFVSLNRRFHSTIIGMSANESLVHELDRYRLIMRHYRNVALRMPGRMKASLDEHRTILQALRQGDAATAESAMRYHLEQARQMLAAVLSVVFESDLAMWANESDEDPRRAIYQETGDSSA